MTLRYEFPTRKPTCVKTREALEEEFRTIDPRHLLRLIGSRELNSKIQPMSHRSETKAVILPAVTIGIAGGTGAGKTTLSKALLKHLGSNAVYLEHDYYYKDLRHLTVEEREIKNFDHPDSLDTDLLVKNLRDLKAGKTVAIPKYDFATHCRRDETDTKHPRKIIIVEGILIFTHPDLVREMDIKVFVDCEADLRLIRRISRDCAERGRTVENVIDQYKATVRPMHDEHVEPSKREADLVVHSRGYSLEVAVKTLTNHLMVEAGIVVRKSADERESPKS